MAAYAALVSLMNNIEQIQRHTRLPIHFDQKQSQSLLVKVNFLIDFLESYDYHGAGEKMKNLESQIRDVAYAADDIIETHVVDKIHAHSRSIKGEGDEVITPSCLPDIEKVMEDMDFIKEEAMKMKENGMQTRSPITTHLSTSFPPIKNNMVGFDDQLLELMERLAEDKSNRQIIPIVGMGGIGKTTLARTAYEKSFTVNRFDFRAWVSISQVYDFKQIVLGLLPNESSQMSDNELAQRLHKSLCGRRYLVVLDDMWGIDAWNMVNLFLPDNKNGSRIIVTTRVSSVATHLDTCSLNMRFLDEHESWILFCEKVFVQEHCPLELEEVGRKIVENCKRLPLSIIVIGGHLAKLERRKEYWEHVARDTKAIINLADDEHCMRILSLSYQNLPVHLKPCFLYIGAFSEDKQILASTLIKLWVAEGILKSNCTKELEVLGEKYLNDLISRNLIMDKRRGLNGKIKSCMVHDLLRDICLIEAQNDKFMYTQKLCGRGEEQYIGSQRRISLHESASNAESSPQVHDTLKSQSMTRTLICNEGHKALQLQNLRLMRVLNYIDTGINNRIECLLNDTFQLVNLRLITIRTTSDPIIPSTLCLLWNLQILIVNGTQDRPVAPLEIWEMTELRHLQYRWQIYLPDPPPSQQMNTKECDTTMKNLHTLKGIIDFRLSDEVIKRISNIKKLEISYEVIGKELEEMSLKSLALLQNLESLNLSFKQQPGSDLLSYLTFPNSLKKLTLWRCGLQWEDMSMIASIPLLEMLKLISDAFVGPKWVLDEEIFRCLKNLQISYCEDLVHWIADDTHFPRLEYLRLQMLDKLVEIPSGFGDIPTLQKIVLSGSKSAMISAKRILDEQENLGNMSLQVEVYVQTDAELESLANDNFVVHTARIA